MGVPPSLGGAKHENDSRLSCFALWVWPELPWRRPRLRELASAASPTRNSPWMWATARATTQGADRQGHVQIDAHRRRRGRGPGRRRLFPAWRNEEVAFNGAGRHEGRPSPYRPAWAFPPAPPVILERSGIPMTTKRSHNLFAAVCVCLLAGFAGTAFGQPEVMAWGNVTGIRVDGQLMELNTSMCVAQPDWAGVTRTGREKQTNSYARNGKVETVTVQMRPQKEYRDPAPGHDWALAGKETVEDTGPGSAKVDVEFATQNEANIAGAFLCMDLPAAQFSRGPAQVIAPAPPATDRVSLTAGTAEQNEYVRATASGVRFITPRRQIEVTFDAPTEIVVRDDRRKGSYDLQVFMTVIPGKAAAGQTVKRSFALKVAGEVDKNPVELSLDASHPGQIFDGLGGNFRLQNAGTDPAVIQYNLDNLRVAWGRVEMPWSTWQRNEDVDPLAAARAGNLNSRIAQAMEMARKLAQKGIPVIVSAWSAPSWAILGSLGGRGGFGGAGAPGAAGGRGAAGVPWLAGAPRAGRAARNPGHSEA